MVLPFHFAFKDSFFFASLQNGDPLFLYFDVPRIQFEMGTAEKTLGLSFYVYCPVLQAIVSETCGRWMSFGIFSLDASQMGIGLVGFDCTSIYKYNSFIMIYGLELKINFAQLSKLWYMLGKHRISMSNNS